MGVDIKVLLSKYRIEWRDRGKNVSEGNIVTRCPFCGTDDHGEHLSIALDLSGFYCYRKPSHAGRSLSRLFKKLNIPASEYAGKLPIVAEPAQRKEDTNNYSIWNTFEPASSSQEAMDYLINRGFSEPERVVKQFDLRISKLGIWARRLLIPLTVGWTGRAMDPRLELRYKAFSNEDGFFKYSHRSSSVIIVEGALDAMRIASVSNQFDVIGKCGKRLNPAWLVYLRTQKYLSIYNLPDADVLEGDKLTELRLIASYCTQAATKNVSIPKAEDISYLGKLAKDIGGLSEAATRSWLYSTAFAG